MSLTIYIVILTADPEVKLGQDEVNCRVKRINISTLLDDIESKWWKYERK